MSVEKVRAYLEHFGVSDRIREFDVSSATVELAAVAAILRGRIRRALTALPWAMVLARRTNCRARSPLISRPQ